MGDPDPTTRFSDRVTDYRRHRPGYPDELMTALQHDVGLSAESTVADIGSGTGISSELLLRIGCTVFGVEPNAAMRGAAESRLGGEPRFRSVNGRAEATTLAARSVDAVTAGQAFHWFSADETRTEFLRILQPGGIVALFWNTRLSEGTPFLCAYEQLLRQFGTDYMRVKHLNEGAAALATFFGGPYWSHVYPNVQVFDYDGLRGRLLSSSYAPGPEHPDHAAMLGALRQLFDAHQESGRVRMAYRTELFFGRLE